MDLDTESWNKSTHPAKRVKRAPVRLVFCASCGARVPESKVNEQRLCRRCEATEQDKGD
jgi:uncharacterized protein YlaI